jgi:predicted  nucleic acid-binding Zn-ribbon protein
MIEAIMYMGIGFLLGGLVGLMVVPLVHNRAVRLTIRRLQAAIPQTMAEIEADKDLLRAEFAMSTRRFEMNIEKVKARNAGLLVQLGKRNEIIDRLKNQHDAEKAKVRDLTTEIEDLKKRLPPVVKRPDAKVHVVRQMIPRRRYR